MPSPKSSTAVPSRFADILQRQYIRAAARWKQHRTDTAGRRGHRPLRHVQNSPAQKNRDDPKRMRFPRRCTHVCVPYAREVNRRRILQNCLMDLDLYVRRGRCPHRPDDVCRFVRRRAGHRPFRTAACVYGRPCGHFAETIRPRRGTLETASYGYGGTTWASSPAHRRKMQQMTAACRALPHSH